MVGFFVRKDLASQAEIPKTNFNYQNADHLKVLSQRMLRFKQARDVLHDVDANIVRGVSVGCVAWFAGYLLPFATAVSVVGFCYATHYASHRPDCFKEYKTALNELIAAYQWSMGQETADHWHKLGSKQMQELILTLGPCVLPSTLCTWKNTDLEPANSLSVYTRESEPTFEFKAKLVQFAAGEHMKDWQFDAYGENASDNWWGALKVNSRDLVKQGMSQAAAMLSSRRP